MTKEDLKRGNVVRIKDGRLCLIVSGGELVNIADGLRIINLNSYDHDLKNSGTAIFKLIFESYNIEEVYEDYTLKNLLWRRVHPLTDKEKVILSNVSKKYPYIARDKNGILFLYEDKPVKNEYQWNGKYITFEEYKHLFLFIKWEDEKPYLISELLDNAS